jgi:hypothetical protein
LREFLHRTDTEDTGMPQRPHKLERIPPQNRYRGYRHASKSACIGENSST